ncbi:HAMP domain-containing sensor histidine kinase [Williamsia muralis]|uniref:Signal transduction histidine-protein kinase/phosphatase MprB n=1 Tax=Williamsia marianensis TaxID=85044 RepID=A0ABU4EM23_WILMA|nr:MULTISPECIES: HAMP domain-containing sensor histidine kinase [Williamsia]MDV7132289.1 HAMP domain-containing sensor histidine kinase [Williamsia muralis]PVY34426.1 signal transduction histidine kinase [Williamsia marianensis]
MLPRPLDPLHSFKFKTAVVVGCALFTSSVSFWITAQWQFRYALLMALLVAIVVTFVLAHGMTSPLREMTGAVRRMSRGDYTARVRATSRDEIGTLATAFNQMADDLAGEDRYRREVIGNVAHELRTPVAALHAVLENMVDGVRTPDQETLELALSQTDRLGRLITELLDLSRIEGGVAKLDHQRIDLACFAETAVAECRLRSPGDISFAIDVAAALHVHADEGRLHQVLANLLDNAARHSPPGGVVEVSAWPEGEVVVIDVADQGPGIAPAERLRIFERFSRGGSRDGGTGLGLAIAQWVITLHAGDIGVVDDPEGCRIRIRLPLVPAD